MVGNMISDFVKGKKQFDFPKKIYHGISLHRLIDTFTDAHPATKQAKEFFRPHYRLYAGAFVDVVFDHFLANHENEFNENSLQKFSQQVYKNLDEYTDIFPEKFSRFYPYMKDHNWLANYRNKEGTALSLGGVVRRSKYLTESDSAFRIFEEYYQPLQECFRLCWTDLKPYALKEFEIFAAK
jgi:acyl carrier protein phosphodiesterase